MPAGDLKCDICLQKLSSLDQGKIVICPEPDCRHTSHVPCLGKQYLLEDPESLLPTQGSCPGCGKTHTWGELIKGAQFRHLLHTKGNVEVNEDEFADLEFDGQSASSEASMSDSTSSEDVPLKAQNSEASPSEAPKESKSKLSSKARTASPERPVKVQSPPRKRKTREGGSSKSVKEKETSPEILVID